MKSLPAWLQAVLPLVVLIVGAIVVVVHLQDKAEQNYQAILDNKDEIRHVDDIVRDNQQRLAHIEALLNGRIVKVD